MTVWTKLISKNGASDDVIEWLLIPLQLHTIRRVRLSHNHYRTFPPLYFFDLPRGFGWCGRRNWGMWFCVRRRHPFSNHRHIVWPQNKWKLRSVLVLVCQKQNEESWYWLNHTRLPGWARPNAYSGCPTWNLWKLSAMWEFCGGGDRGGRRHALTL